MLCTNEDFNYIDMRNWGLFIAYYSILYSVNGIPNYGTSMPFFPGQRRIVKYPLTAVNLFLRTWVLVKPAEWKLIYQQYFWNSVKKCYIVGGIFDLPHIYTIPCNIITKPTPPNCCC